MPLYDLYHPHWSVCERFWTNGRNDAPKAHIRGLEGGQGAKTVKKWVFFSHFRSFLLAGPFQSLLLVSIAYQNVWHKILGRLRPLPTMCGALGSHRIEKNAKKSAQIPPFWWIITIPLHFGELGGVLATLTIKKVIFRMARGTSDKIFMALGPQRWSRRRSGSKKPSKRGWSF